VAVFGYSNGQILPQKHLQQYRQAQGCKSYSCSLITRPSRVASHSSAQYPTLIAASSTGGTFTFRQRLAEAAFVQSMNRPNGKMTDNAVMESFFHTLKAECTHGGYFAD